MKKLRTGDPVIVISGKNKGKISNIEKIDGDLVVVKDVNVVKKAVKGQGFVKKTLPIHISNIMYYLSKDKKSSKIKIETTKDGKKIRKTKKGNIEVK
ncbi:MAG TPA: 50S ribosomal protein L24 [Candidatus Absconditabacterales bacterium]|nr:50S ribosomal protein L24 [Candidatus Absconditabacterales bacterium]